MSLLNYESIIKDGDEVVLYYGFNRMKLLRVKKGDTHQTTLGAIRHNNIIGKKYGSKLNCPKGYLYVMHLTPELWTLTLPHRTQILYSTDISMIMLQLDIRPGVIVIESGKKFNVSDKVCTNAIYLLYPTLQFSTGVGKREKANGV